jgi:hypothetical protein
MITSDRIKPYLDNFLDIRSLLLYLLGLASRIKDKLFPIADKKRRPTLPYSSAVRFEKRC